MFTGSGQIRHISEAITPHHRLKMLVLLVIFRLNLDLFVRRFARYYHQQQSERYPAQRLMVKPFAH